MIFVQLGYLCVRWCGLLVLWVFFSMLNWMFQHNCLDTYCFWVPYMHAFSIFEFAPVQCNWACFTWKSTLEIRSLLLLLLLLLKMTTWDCKAATPSPPPCPYAMKALLRVTLLPIHGCPVQHVAHFHHTGHLAAVFRGWQRASKRDAWPLMLHVRVLVNTCRAVELLCSQC